MSRLLARALLLAVLSSLLLTSAVSAGPGGTFRSSVVIANPGTVIANVSLRFYNVAGALVSTIPVVVQPGAAHLVYIPNQTSVPNGRYALQTISDQYVSVLVNLTSDDARTSTAYPTIPSSGISPARGTTLYIPNAFPDANGHQNTFVIFNGGNEAASDVTVTFRGPDAAVVATSTLTIAPFGTGIVDVPAVANIGSGFRGAVVTGTQPLTGIVLTHHPAIGRLGAARAVTVGASALYMPVIYRQYFGYTTSFVTQAVTAATGLITAGYFRNSGESAGGFSPTEASHLFVLDQASSTVLPTGFNGSIVLQSTSGSPPIAATALVLSNSANFEMYNGIPSSQASSRATCMSMLNNYFNYNTSLTVQNVSGSPTNLTLDYVDRNGASVLRQNVENLASGAAYFNYTPSNPAVPNGFNGAVNVTSSGSPIVAVVNELLGIGSEPGDQLFSYTCDNTVPTSQAGTFFSYGPLVLQNASIN